eukprot:1554076-Pleurochrysis_carterae.AAC.1
MAIRVEVESEEEDYDVVRLAVADVLAESFDIPLVLYDTGLNEALADDRLNLDQVVNTAFVRLRTWARREQIMPQY